MKRKSPKFDEVYGQVSRLAVELGHDQKLPTFAALCKAFDVSSGTLSGVLDKLESEQVIIRRHGVGIYASPKLVRRYALVGMQDAAPARDGSPFARLLLDAIRRRAAAGGIDLSLYSMLAGSNSDTPLPAGFMKELTAHRIHGVLFSGMGTVQAELLDARNIPLVSFAGSGHYFVEMDMLYAIEQGIASLKRAGCKRIGIWSLHVHTPWTTEELRAVLGQADVPFYPELCFIISDHVAGVPRDSDKEIAYHSATSMFGAARETWPDGLVVANDLMTQGVLTALHNLGVRPGADVRIASHANRGSSVLLGYERSLTLLEFDPDAVADNMFMLLDKLVSGKEPGAQPVRLRPRIVEQKARAIMRGSLTNGARIARARRQAGRPRSTLTRQEPSA